MKCKNCIKVEDEALKGLPITDIIRYCECIQPERSKREDTNIVCPKCKEPLKNCSYLMMGIDKTCFKCNVDWTKRHGFDGYPPSPGNL